MPELCQECGATNEEINLEVESGKRLCLGCYEQLGPKAPPLTFEHFEAEHGHLNSYERKAAFEALPERLQAEAWAQLARKVEDDRDQTIQETRRRTTDWRAIDARLREVPATDYVERLAGVEVRDMICCPLPDHEDDSPSFKVYEDRKWHCFGCGRTGAIYEFAGLMWGLEMKGESFKDAQRRLATIFGLL